MQDLLTERNADILSTSLFDLGFSEFWQKLFISATGQVHGIVNLDKIPYWQYLINHLGLSCVYSPKQVKVIGSCFVGLHSNITGIDLKDEEICAKGQGAKWLMIPFVRRNHAEIPQLVNRGFIGLPWSIESETREVGNDLDGYLSRQIGHKRFTNLRRLVRRANENCQLRFDIKLNDDGHVTLFDLLHSKNIEKYGHSINPYSKAQLEIIRNFHVPGDFGFTFTTNIQTKETVQSSLNYIENNRKFMSMLVQGIDHQLKKGGLNLYLSETYLNYQHYLGLGIEIFNLGRGAPVNKLNLGCNYFHVLEHYIKPLEKNCDLNYLIALKALSATLVEKQLDELNFLKKNSINIF